MTFSRMIKFGSMLGGAHIASLLTVMARAKLVAMTLGPAGIGLAGLITTFNGNISAFAAWGLETSGVRTIASSEEAEKSHRRAAVIRFGKAVSAVGFVLAALLALPVCQITFGTDDYGLELFIGGLAVPCAIASTMWTSILQAYGKIGALARVQTYSVTAALVVGAPLIYFFSTVGMALSIFIAAAISAMGTWWAAKSNMLADERPVRSADLLRMFKLGGGLVVVGCSSQVAAYSVRLMIVRHYDNMGGNGLTEAGFYQAAFVIAGSLTGVVFGAMSADFFPRVAAAKDEQEALNLSENQILVGLLLALPILTALMTMSGVGLRILYNERFEPAGPLLSWMIWGVFLRLLSWPLGYWMLARGSPSTFILVELAGNGVMIALPWIFLPKFGVLGAAYSFAASYVIYALAMLFVSRCRSGKWICLRVLLWYFIAASWLAAAQATQAAIGGGWWGLLPSSMSALLCAGIYYRQVRIENLTRGN